MHRRRLAPARLHISLSPRRRISLVLQTIRR